MDARLREGIRLFNAGLFFQSHEALEDFYVASEEKDKPFLEGLIQAATALRLFRDFGEVEGAVRMIYQALIRLENYQPTYLGVRVKDFIQALESWAKQAEANSAKIGEEIPKIRVHRFSFFS